jgi:DNA-binding LacI/PurR family transcriptional regulator
MIGFAGAEYQKALSYLNSFLDSRIANNVTGKLPGIRWLAKSAGVSKDTMWKAVRHMREKGLIVVAPKKGIALAGSSDRPMPGPPPETLRPWQRVHRALVQDIIDSRFAPDHRLPTLKELEKLYSASAPTLQKAIAAGLRQGYLAAHKRGYRVRESTAAASTFRILILIYFEPILGGRFFITPRDEEFIRAIERECPRRNISFDIQGYTRKSGRFYFVDRQRGRNRRLSTEQYFGFCILGNIESFLAEYLSPILLAVHGVNKPIAVIDADHTQERAFDNPMVRIFALDTTSESPGRTIGRRLQMNGHRRILYIAPYDNRWVQCRLRGLVSAYAEAGLTDTVKPVIEERLSSIYDTSGPHVRGMKEISAQANKTFSLIKKMRRSSSPATMDFLTNVEGLTHLAVTRANEYEICLPLFENALADTTATAWVCANDMTALNALNFLEKNGRAVPRDLSIAGFDDSIDAFAANLSSYHFDYQNAVNRMLAFIINPRDPYFSRSGPRIDCPGFFVERRSISNLGKTALRLK